MGEGDKAMADGSEFDFDGDMGEGDGSRLTAFIRGAPGRVTVWQTTDPVFLDCGFYRIISW